MTTIYQVQSNSDTETKKIAENLASYLKPGDVITLEGDLGAGKTTFTKGLAVGMGIKRVVTSPTFTIIKQYNGKMPLYHMDAYRLENSDEDIGFDEYFYGKGVTVVEWAKYIGEYLPEERLAIAIKTNEKNRTITFQSNNEHFNLVLNKLREAKIIESN